MYILNALWNFFFKVRWVGPNLTHFEKKYKVLWFAPKLNALLIFFKMHNFFKMRFHNARMQLCMRLQSGSHTLGLWWAGSVTLTPAAECLTVEQGGVKNVKLLTKDGRHTTRINSKRSPEWFLWPIKKLTSYYANWTFNDIKKIKNKGGHKGWERVFPSKFSMGF